MLTGFQETLRELDDKIAKIIYKLDNEFIYEIQQLDDQVINIERQL